MNRETPPQLVRAVGRWGLTALVLNALIGSGIFGLPSPVAALLGGASPLAYLVAAAGTGAIVGCFAEVASRFPEAGGPYLYARVAFGRFAGIGIAWLTWLVRLAAAAANANLFVVYLVGFWPHANEFAPRLAILALLLGFLAAVNYRGVGWGARLSSTFALAKLLPLLAFVAIGLFFVRGTNVRIHSGAGAGGWLDAVVLLIYAFGGFEAALIPMREAKDPRRDAPFALMAALGVAALLFTLVQLVVVGVLAAPEQTDRPLAVAAGQFLGAPGSVLMTVGALVSVYGYLSSMMLNVPRLTYALGERGDFPPFFAAVHPRFRTPHLSILVFALLVWVLAGVGSFSWNVALSSVARLLTYASTCVAMLVLRKEKPVKEAFRLPAAVLFVVLSLAFCAVLVTRMGRAELLMIAATGLITVVNWQWARRSKQASRN